MQATIRRAGDVTGVPGWQMDRLFETDNARFLEKNQQEDFNQPLVVAALNSAYFLLGQADIQICHAGDNAEGTQWEKGIDSMIERLEELRCDLDALTKKIEGREMF